MQQEFFIIDIESLLNDCITDFDLYILIDNKYVLFRSANLEFNEKHRANILSRKLKLYISNKEKIKYINYIKKNILENKNANIDLSEKNKYFYYSSKVIVESIFSDTQPEHLNENIKVLSDAAVSILDENDYDLKNILKIMQFEYSTYTHSLNISLLCSTFANVLNQPQELIPRLVKGALLHDIGKSKIDNKILLKPGKLTNEEWEIIKTHPILGVELLKETNINDEIITQMVKYHHEKFDGNGYPERLKNNEIPFAAQIIAICDVFDALTSQRAYKTAVGSFPAFKIMLNEMDGSFNKELLTKFINIFKE